MSPVLPPREHGPAFARRGAILLPLLSAALFALALLLHGSAAEAQALSKPAPAQLVRLHLGAYLFWHESSGADGYEIQTRSQSGGTWGNWSSISYTGTTQPATVTGLTAGTKYQWRIRATSGSEQSEWSAHDDVSDLAYNWTGESFGRNIANPAVLQSAEPGDPGEVTVTWTHGPARSGVTITGWTVGYRLFSEPVNQTRQTSLLPASATMGTVTGLTGGEQYEFWVRPYVGGVPGRTSNALEATPTTTTAISTPIPTQSSDATLRALSVSAGGISPAFSSTTYAYTVSVASGVTSTTVTPTVNHSAATVTVNGTTVGSGTASGSIPLDVGANVITVRVTAENGATQDYTVTITRQSRNADLSALSASTATSEAATYSPQTLTPAFAAGTTSYTATVGNAMTHAKVTPTVNHSAATVTVNGTMVASGTDSAAIALNVGANEIIVRVTAEDTSITRDYTVTITRQSRDAADGSPPAPSGLTVTPCPHCLSVTWTASGGTVSGYDVHYTTMSEDDLADDAEVGYYQHPRAGRIVNRHPGRGWVTLPNTTKEPKYGMGYLQPGQEYRVRVRAYNSDGAGPWAVGKGTPLEARRTVSLSASAERVREGDPVTITATVEYNGRPSPIQEDMDVLLRIHLGTAESSDVGTLERISIGKYTSSGSATIQTHRDGDGDDETFAVLIRSIPKRDLARAGHPSIVWVTITEGDPTPPEPVNAAPTVASAIGDVTGLIVGGTRDVSLSGVFSDADNDALTITASSSDNGKATVSVASDGSKLALTGVAEGTATVTVTAQDAGGNRVSDRFTVTVEAPAPSLPAAAPADGTPTVAAPLADISLRGPEQRAISLAGVFNDPNGDSLIITAVSSHHHIASMWTSFDYSTLTVVGISTGTATITVTARDTDGNEVSDEFEVTVSPAS